MERQSLSRLLRLGHDGEGVVLIGKIPIELLGDGRQVPTIRSAVDPRESPKFGTQILTAWLANCTVSSILMTAESGTFDGAIRR